MTLLYGMCLEIWFIPLHIAWSSGVERGMNRARFYFFVDLPERHCIYRYSISTDYVRESLKS